MLHSGETSHQQNRAFVNLLGIDLQPFEADAVRNRPEGSLLAFVDHREGVGATATILTESLRELSPEVDAVLGTTLLFAIRRETLEFLRGATREEYDAAGWLHGYADGDLLRTLSTPSVTGATIDSIAAAIRNRTARGSVLISGIERTSERDALPQAADYLATLEGVETAVVFAFVGGGIQPSARSTDSRIHVGRVLDAAFDDVGSAGGHREMAGGEVPLGVFAGYTDDDQPFAIVEQAVAARLIAELNLASGAEA